MKRPQVRVHVPGGGSIRVRIADGTAELRLSLSALAGAMGGDPIGLEREGNAPLDPSTLRLEDFHVLRAVLSHEGVLAEDKVERPCENCGFGLSARPSEALEIAPYLDGELDDPELDAPFPFGKEQDIPAVTGNADRDRVRLRPVTVGEAMPLFLAVEKARLRLTSEVVRAMGIASLSGEERPAVIARRLSRGSEEALEAVLDLFDAAHYAPRLSAQVKCPSCGARNGFDAPALREFQAVHAPRPETATGFPELDAFEHIVTTQAERLYRMLGIGEVALTVHDGVPDCDDGGVPLLGSYVPPEPEEAGIIARPPEVTLYYQTFRAMWVDDGPYELEAEIAETIEHELRHHLAWLAGDDPEDEAERAEIAEEERRTVGSTEVLRRASRGARTGFVELLRRTWPLWLLVIAVAVLSSILSR
jgi:hypothetical protein